MARYVCTEKKIVFCIIDVYFFFDAYWTKLTLMRRVEGVCGNLNLSTHDGVVETLYIPVKLFHDGFSHMKYISFLLFSIPNLQNINKTLKQFTAIFVTAGIIMLNK